MRSAAILCVPGEKAPDEVESTGQCSCVEALLRQGRAIAHENVHVRERPLDTLGLLVQEGCEPYEVSPRLSAARHAHRTHHPGKPTGEEAGSCRRYRQSRKIVAVFAASLGIVKGARSRLRHV